MAQSPIRREIPSWTIAVVVGVIVIVIAVVGFQMSRPAQVSGKVTYIGPSSNSSQSYLSHYSNPPAGSHYSSGTQSSSGQR